MDWKASKGKTLEIFSRAFSFFALFLYEPARKKKFYVSLLKTNSRERGKIGSSFLQPWLRTKNLMLRWHVGFAMYTNFMYFHHRADIQEWHKDDAFNRIDGKAWVGLVINPLFFHPFKDSHQLQLTVK